MDRNVGMDCSALGNTYDTLQHEFYTGGIIAKLHDLLEIF